MKYLHIFDTAVEHDAVYGGDGYYEPWVAYTISNEKVTYNRPDAESVLSMRLRQGPFEFFAVTDGPPPPQPPLTLGENYELTVDVFNSGSTDVSNVVVRIDYNNTSQTVTIPFVQAGSSASANFPAYIGAQNQTMSLTIVSSNPSVPIVETVGFQVVIIGGTPTPPYQPPEEEPEQSDDED